MAYLEIMTEINQRIADAQTRYGDFASTHEALGVACEEWDELRDAIHKNAFESVKMECLDLAAVLIRLASSMNNQQTINRSSK